MKSRPAVVIVVLASLALAAIAIVVQRSYANAPDDHVTLSIETADPGSGANATRVSDPDLARMDAVVAEAFREAARDGSATVTVGVEEYQASFLVLAALADEQGRSGEFYEYDGRLLTTHTAGT